MPSEGAVPSFDLTSERWLPVQRLDGTEDELSLREVLTQVGDLRRLVGDVPTQEFALLRLLLAIVHDAIDGPRDLDEWQELWDDGLPLGRIIDYLDGHRARFDLLHPSEPFLQTAGLCTATGETGSLDRIIADVPNGMPFFTMRARGADRLGFAEAARWLVHAHGFDTSGIKTGVVGDPRVKGGKVYPQGVAWSGNLGGVLVEGADLRETLLLNLIAFDTPGFRIDPDHDAPAWRRPAPGPGQMDPVELSRRPAGVRDLYTWQSRRVRLACDAQGAYGVILAYGDPLAPHNFHQREPMTGWRRSPAQEKKLGLAQVYLPREHDPSRSAWRGLGALVAGRAEGAEQRQEAAAIVRPRILDWVARLTVEGDLPADFPIRARLFGAVYGTQQSVIDEIIDDAVAMPVVLLHERDRELGQAAIDAVTDAERAVTAFGDLAADLARAAGTEADPRRAMAREFGFGTLDGPFRDWLARIRPDDVPHAQRAAWQREAHRIVSRLGVELLNSAGDAAWEGRKIQTRQGQELWLTASYADRTFRRSLGRALPLARADEARPPEEDSDSERQRVEAQ
ncbi:type I-E CRISPR-associated protein Cse1/CasA [Sphaerimonospora thailandensis]|uniref:Type I-E CRISPR-associated protein Cse1/CasA n=1 Tax=Sphaerimonospora thailandensis TaxID=795644 RepID=A0A8J3W1W2_9ACTN|nr:type I-E CRISPR-associated protein Cse1/CasA [Sphaerimonospora thailandensis]GIH72650.1 type I-E CRISPR-associated protein Cse1/CasA [Sphaerimonospora thailandensis]